MISGRRNLQATEMNPGTSPRTLDLWKGAAMPTRKAHARWEGSLKEGRGEVDFGNGLFRAAYSFSSRFEDGKGTNPEELLGAAHAGCFAMALSLILGNAGFKPDYVTRPRTLPSRRKTAASRSPRAISSARARCPTSTRRRLHSTPRKRRRAAQYRKLSPAPRSRSMPSSLQIDP